ncbi:MAG: amino acid ABC transporter substrate-binding protein [Variibacter sp.]|nr:amino acid ABC transporter substrate-binding protein [Variibacter sp.]
MTSASAGKPIRIGYSSDLSGEQAESGKAAWLSHQIWREEINARGGLLGRPVEFVHYDDGNDPAIVPGLYAKLIDEDKVDLVLGGYGNTNQSAALPVAAERQKLFIGVHGTAINEKLNYDRYFQLLPTGPNARLAMSKGFMDIAATLRPKPQTLALLRGDDANQAMIMTGARETAAAHGFRIVFDEVCPKDVEDPAPLMRRLQAAEPDIVFFSLYPTDCVRLVNAARAVGLEARMVGGKMTGVQLAAVKAKLGSRLNGIVAHDIYSPEPTMNFPGIERFLARYRARAAEAGTDALGLYVPPFAYAQMEVLQQAVETVGAIDQAALARYMHQATFKTVVGDIRFGPQGEWERSRIIWVQYRNVTDDGIDQFMRPGRQVILYPDEFKSGEIATPFPG